MMTVPVTIRTLLMIQCMLNCVIQLSTSRMLDDKLSPNEIKALRQLCPRTDICIWNASEPVVRRNRILEDGRRVSSCYGCSCHEDCHDMLNCCFPGDMDTGDDAAASTTLVSHSVDNNTTSPSILDNTSDPGVTVTSSENQEDTSQLDEASMSDDRPTSIKQCLYAQTRAPTFINRYFDPAYRIVSRAPPGGCIPDVSIDRATGEDPCGSRPVAPWGDLYPVISTEHGTIYKNALCARCHGASDFDHMEAVMVCDTYDSKTGQEVSSSNHFMFLEQNSMPSFCFIAFDYKDRAMLKDSRCFVNAVASCPVTHNADAIRIPDGVNITYAEVIHACHSGLNSPVLIDEAYQNAFCVICNKNESSLLDIYEFEQDRRGFGAEKVTYLLDVSFLVENAKQEEGPGISTPHPEACFPDDVLGTVFSFKEKQSCRRLFCPTGQVRDNAGVCMYLSQKWYTGGFSITVKLTYVNKSTLDDDRLVLGQISRNALFEGLRSASPWPSRWKIRGILRTSDDAGVEPSIVVELIAAVTNPLVVFRTLRVVMARPWFFSVDKINIPFKQSLFKYTTFPDRSDRFVLLPEWKDHIYGNESVRYFANVSSLSWRILYYDDMSVATFPYSISKLFTCESVALLNGEYTLMANNLVLINKLTGSVMFDKEFDLFEHENGQPRPHVCLSDTPLLLRTLSSGALSLFGNVLPTVLLFFPVLKLLLRLID